jgi:hypothetical protein
VTGRIVAIITAAVLGAIVAGFAAIALLGTQAPIVAEPAPGSDAVIESRGGGFAFAGSAGPWRVEGDLLRDVEGPFRLRLHLMDEHGRPASPPLVPQIDLTMPDHAMERVTPPVESVGAGAHRSMLALPMPGRWRMTIRLDGDVLVLDLDVRG